MTRESSVDLWAFGSDKFNRSILRPVVLLHQVGGDNHATPADPGAAVNIGYPAGELLSLQPFHCLAQPINFWGLRTVADRQPLLDFAMEFIFYLAHKLKTACVPDGGSGT